VANNFRNDNTTIKIKEDDSAASKFRVLVNSVGRTNTVESLRDTVTPGTTIEGAVVEYTHANTTWTHKSPDADGGSF